MSGILRRIIDSGKPVVAPGVGDALTAMLVEQAGFDCVYMSGYQVSALHGFPDVGLLTLTEMVAQAAQICARVDVPVIVDGDNGHGNAVNVIRTVRLFEQAGVSAIHLEDQALPKKCGHMSGHVLVSSSEMCAKVTAAVEARRSADCMIIARSDAMAIGMDEVIRRSRAYRQAGADALMLMAPRSRDDLKRFRDGVDGPLVVTMGSWDLQMGAGDLDAMGYQIVLFPVSLMRRSLAVVRSALAELKATGAMDHGAPGMVGMHDLHDILGLRQVTAWQERYAVAD